MIQYLNLIKFILKNGIKKSDRTNTGTKSIFGYQMRFNLKKGFPILTTKKIYFKSIIYELIWFLTGSKNIKYLKKNNINIWNNWADENDNIGPSYGYQWIYWPTNNNKHINQIKKIINKIKKNPNSRRLIVSAWNVADIKKTKLPPCHVLFQFYVSNNNLSCQLYQRSADVFIGLPFNITSYALLIHMIAQQTKLKVGEFIWTGGDCHLYKTHLKQAKIQLKRTPTLLPKLKIINKPKSIFNYKFENFKLINYNPQEYIKAKISI
ncbi:thymidylate synthase [Candidatus Zinderia endosymbiont of Aphrophora alni]|uniref:thymidylate synthase n=1 Tax=Candidatus Zinderia endosymbiont of Aphrophora alni TaxID=3077951 RepID=UPI0030CCAF58